MKLILIIKNQTELLIRLKRGGVVADETHLTISQNLDTLLIVAIDNLMAKNRIDRLSLKTMEIRGNIKAETVSSMILRTVKSGLES